MHGLKPHQGADLATAPLSDGLAQLILARTPFEVLVVHPEQGLLGYNERASKLVTHLESDDQRLPCCALLGCREPGPLAEVCVTEAAYGSVAPLPEVRVDLGAADLSRWVTASFLSDEGGVLLQLRPGAANDRRRRTEPHWSSGPELEIKTLGAISVHGAEGSIGGEWLQQRPGQLLKYFLCERDRVLTAEEIADVVWPGEGERALTTLRHYVHVLRDKLEPGRAKRAPSSFIVATKRGYSLDRSRVRIDADLFEQLVRTGAAAFFAEQTAVARESLSQAMDLYRGDFLAEDPYNESAFSERDRLRDLAARTCRMLGQIALAAGDLDSAARHVERLSDLEPLDTEVQKALLTLYLRTGRNSQAVRRYKLISSSMRRELGEGPAFELTDLTRELEEPLRLA